MNAEEFIIDECCYWKCIEGGDACFIHRFRVLVETFVGVQISVPANVMEKRTAETHILV